MRRFLIFVFIISFCSSCDYFSFQRKKDLEKVDTNLDTTSVDTPPSFEECNSIIDKEEKTKCFRNVIHKEISSSLEKQNIKVKKKVDETIQVVMTIHADHRITLKSVEASEHLMKQIPDLKKIIEKSIGELPKVRAAIKRDLPVTSEYLLPIRIKLGS